MNSRINIQNYESFMIDFLEGTLSEDLVNEMDQFLSENPEILDEVAMLSEMPTLSEDTLDISFNDPLSLMKPTILSEDEISFQEELALKILEKDADSREILQHHRLYSNSPEYKKCSDSISRLKVEPDLSIQFKNKAGLKRLTIIPVPAATLSKISSIAASLVIVFLASQWYINQGLSDETRMASYFSYESDYHPDRSTEQYKNTFETENQLVASSISLPGKITPMAKENHYTPRQSVSLEAQQIKKVDHTLFQNPEISVSAGFIHPIAPSFRYFQSDAQDKNEALTVKEYLIQSFNKRVLNKDPEEEDIEELAFSDITKAGMEKIEEISNNKINWESKRNEEGNLIAYSFKTPFFEISKEKK